MKFLLKILIVLSISCALATGFDFWGIFGSSNSTATTPAPRTTIRVATTPSPPQFTYKVVTMPVRTTPSGACWWTECGKRCTATANVHESTQCQPGTSIYKFKCCSGR